MFHQEGEESGRQNWFTHLNQTLLHQNSSLTPSFQNEIIFRRIQHLQIGHWVFMSYLHQREVKAHGSGFTSLPPSTSCKRKQVQPGQKMTQEGVGGRRLVRRYKLCSAWKYFYFQLHISTPLFHFMCLGFLLKHIYFTHRFNDSCINGYAAVYNKFYIRIQSGRRHEKERRLYHQGQCFYVIVCLFVLLLLFLGES